MELTAQVHVLGEALLAIALGGAIGYDRELADKPAGFRTHMLVAGAAALLVGLADGFMIRADEAALAESVRVDPIRVIEAVVTGVSFLGAGTIIHNRDKERHVEGLTTAASLLFTAAVGICAGLRLYVLGIGATALALFVLRGLRGLEKRMKPGA